MTRNQKRTDPALAMHKMVRNHPRAPARVRHRFLGAKHGRFWRVRFTKWPSSRRWTVYEAIQHGRDRREVGSQTRAVGPIPPLTPVRFRPAGLIASDRPR